MNDIVRYLASRDVRIITNDTYNNFVTLWESWYSGFVKTFHSYYRYNGLQNVEQKRYSLGMAKTVCEDHATLLLNEKVQISVGSKEFQKVLDEVLEANNFRVRGNQLVEMAFALGTGAFVEFLDAKQAVNIDYINAKQIYPITIVNGEITECAFASVVSNDDEGIVYYINIHRLNEAGNYVIENKKIRTKDKEAPVELTDEALLETVDTGAPIPRFQIIKPNIANNLDLNSGMGLSVFANAIDCLKAVDVGFDGYVNEFLLGKKRVYVPADMVQTAMGSDNVVRPIFDPNDVAFFALSSDSIKTLTESEGELRYEAYDSGIQKFLNLLSKKCGLGTERYSFEAGGVKTATEVISEKSDLYQSMKKHEVLLEGALINLVKTIAIMRGVAPDSLEIAVTFDDSIIQDADAVANRALLEYNAGLIDKVEYYKRVYGLTEAAAIELADDIAKRAPPPPPTPTLFQPEEGGGSVAGGVPAGGEGE